MSKKMLIDATHPEETRVVVAEGSRVEEFDFESINKRQLAGNIYLAKVTRVEPSLQAAFVEYGGNRHGFLAFSEIHPDYYQIPRADREALLAAEAAEAETDEEAEERPAKSRRTSRSRSRTGGRRKATENPERATPPAAEETGLDTDAPVMDAAMSAGVTAENAPEVETAADTMEEAEREEAALAAPSPADVVDADDPEEGGAPPPVDVMAERPSAHLGEVDTAPTDDRAAMEDPEAPRLTNELRDAEAKSPDDRIPESADVEVSGDAVGLSAGAPPAEHMTAPEPDPAAYFAPETQTEEVETPGTEVEGDETEGEEGEGEEGGSRPPRSIAEDAGADQVERVSGEVESRGEDEGGEEGGTTPRRRRRRSRRRDEAGETAAEPADPNEDQVDTVGAEPVEEEVRPRRARRPHYKIQEVIKVRQILLVQVVKEERGNKGAALTTYLSLAGRYCVLMPNTARGGGISRKITSVEDRKKLKEIAGELEVPTGMGLIVRTAGAQRTRAEIRRDYEFLIRQWDQIRELTLKSVAPCLIYEEGSLIKRSIRDLYSKDIDEVWVAGEEGYREAKDYMRMLMPSHAKNVKPYRDPTPLFSRHQVESYLAGMFNPTVQLKSGGYIVIGVTEALVAIDVNSGRSTREGSIEETALKTNLEAAEEVARQLRLRDLAGLIVIDFIDMEERRNNAAVEKRFKEKLKSDRARIQVGRISPFGLLEMSRQRLRPGMIEAVTTPCPHCHGAGTIRSDESLALSILREIEEEGVRAKAREVRVVAPVPVANYLINQKRMHLGAIEARYGVSVAVEGDAGLVSPHYRLDRLKQPTRPAPEIAPAAVSAESAYAGFAEEDEAEEEASAAASPRQAKREEPVEARETARPEASRPDEEEDSAKNRRRRGRRGGRKRRRGGAENGGSENGERDPMPVLGEETEAPEIRRSAFGEEIGETPETAEEPAARQDPEPRKAAEAEPARSAEPAEPAAEAAREEAPAPAEAAPAEEAGVAPPADPAPVDSGRPALTPQLDAAAAASEDTPPVPPSAGEGAGVASLGGRETEAVAESQAEAAEETEARREEEPSEPEREEPARPKRRGWWAAAFR